jgi:hypothetical protein
MIDTIYVCLFFVGFGGTISYFLNKNQEKQVELSNIIKDYSIIQDKSQIPV